MIALADPPPSHPLLALYVLYHPLKTNVQYFYLVCDRVNYLTELTLDIRNVTYYFILLKS